MNYLFLTGAPRSGTSALTELISSHEQISIGMERYKFLYKSGQLSKNHFDKDNFFSFKESETNINNESGKYVDYYRDLEQKFDAAEIVGDKYPQLYKYWNPLFEEFGENAKFVVILRDIHSVASSFNVRAMNPKDKWPVENDYKAAVKIWNEALHHLEVALEGGRNIYVVGYSELFDGEACNVQAQLTELCEFIGVEVTDRIKSQHDEMAGSYVQKVKYKEKVVLDGQTGHINSHANFSLYEKLKGGK